MSASTAGWGRLYTDGIREPEAAVRRRDRWSPPVDLASQEETVRCALQARASSWLIGLGPRRKLLLASRLGSLSAVRSRESHPIRPRCDGHLSHGPAAPLRSVSSLRVRAPETPLPPRFVHPRLSQKKTAPIPRQTGPLVRRGPPASHAD
jgi:hypothetical protein